MSKYVRVERERISQANLQSHLDKQKSMLQNNSKPDQTTQPNCS